MPSRLAMKEDLNLPICMGGRCHQRCEYSALPGSVWSEGGHLTNVSYWPKAAGRRYRLHI